MTLENHCDSGRESIQETPRAFSHPAEAPGSAGTLRQARMPAVFLAWFLGAFIHPADALRSRSETWNFLAAAILGTRCRCRTPF